MKSKLQQIGNLQIVIQILAQVVTPIRLDSLSGLSFLSSEGNNKCGREQRASSRPSWRKCRQKLAGTLRCKFVRQRRVNWGRLRLRRDNTVFLQMSLWAVLTLHYSTWIRLVSKYGLERQPAFATNKARVSLVILSWVKNVMKYWYFKL